MNCKKVREIMFLVTDEDLDQEVILSFREHLSICPRCEKRSQYANKLLVVFRQRCTRTNAPQELRQKILANLSTRGRAPKGWEG